MDAALKTALKTAVEEAERRVRAEVADVAAARVRAAEMRAREVEARAAEAEARTTEMEMRAAEITSEMEARVAEAAQSAAEAVAAARVEARGRSASGCARSSANLPLMMRTSRRGVSATLRTNGTPSAPSSTSDTLLA